MHASGMLLRVRTHFKRSHLARMSDGTFCIIRDLGLVKGGKGMRHHEVLVTLTFKALWKSVLLKPAQAVATVRASKRAAWLGRVLALTASLGVSK